MRNDAGRDAGARGAGGRPGPPFSRMRRPRAKRALRRVPILAAVCPTERPLRLLAVPTMSPGLMQRELALFSLYRLLEAALLALLVFSPWGELLELAQP